MTDPDDYSQARTPQDQAVHWFAKARLGGMTPAERHCFEQWRGASLENDRCYRELESAWALADQLPLEEMRSILARPEVLRAPRRRQLLVGLGAAGSLAVAGAAVLHGMRAQLLYQGAFETRRGERRQVQLPDGSLLDLNTATRVQIAFHEDSRHVDLKSGEAVFTVRRDTARPFTVAAGQARIRVTGTRFGVRKDKHEVTVSVDGGSVEFSAGPWWKATQVRLGAGDIAHCEDGAVSPPYQGDVATRLAWQRGRLVFHDQPLSQVVAELNRYMQQPIRVVDARVARLRVSGTLDINEPQAALELLPEIAPIALVSHKDGSVALAFLGP